MVSYARTERAALADLLAEVGPDAPTLCAGWTTRDLAAHLVVRERRPDSSPGILFKPLAGYTDKVRLRAAARPYEQLVHQVRTGPPRLSLFGIPGVDAAANTVEYFVHLEDVRRAQPGFAPRDLEPGLTEYLWKRGRSGAKLMLRKAPVGVELRRTDTAEEAQPVRVRKGEPTATLAGPPAELLLYVYGRKDEALVTVEGDETAVRRLRETPLGI
ncbi:TIGR03085 family metal-binding protein [Yinghuangia sp. ASG 101]|uniref:TIGR03085 family metal-binding protein n=1 Tax=Yinghuangia sp. ASG 101 TaxID=2896848 RepID=UPI001E49B7F2|nr:TIGR03085 family metal-binding protein [Yinghuangia sp. ASG 101]UGQ10090.1 TIGR03085 family metal-binding protein [Yinghuangia sp. ASG 101]